MASGPAGQAIDQAAAALAELGTEQAKLEKAVTDAAKGYGAVSDRIAELARLASQPCHTQAQLEQRIQQLQQVTQSFDMQYLALQEQMQNESRRFSLLSSIIKTEHDTAKNSISNVR